MNVRALAVVVAVVGLSAAVASAAPLDVRVARGLDGVVAAGGIDVAVVEVRSGGDAAVAGTVELAGRTYPVELAARGVATVTVAARLPAGASSVTALSVRVRIGGSVIEAMVPAARVVRRPIVVIGDAPAALLAAIEPWRQASELGEAIVVAPERMPTRWPVMMGVGAVVLDRPVGELPAAAAAAVRRFLGAGGKVCRMTGAATPTCVQADALAVPLTRVRARLAAVITAWAWAALALAAALLIVMVLPRRRGLAAAAVLALGVAVPVVMNVREADSRLALQGVRAAAGGGEDWLAAELGVSDLAGAVALGGELWIEPTEAEGGGPLDEVGLRGRVPGPGSWRLRGFVPADAGGWADRLTRSARTLPELP